MTTPRQKRKRHSSTPKSRDPTTNPRRRSSKRNPHPNFSSSHPLIAQHWDVNQTVSKNYRRLGIAGKLGHATGGTELGAGEKVDNGEGEGLVREVRVRRDKDGAIVGIVGEAETVGEVRGRTAMEERFEGRGLDCRLAQAEQGVSREYDSLRDERETGEADEEEFAGFADAHAPDGQIPAPHTNDTEVIRGLEEEAMRLKSMPKKKRRQSEREREWCRRLVDRHGGDVAAMARDAKLNVMQQSEGDVGRRTRLYLKER